MLVPLAIVGPGFPASVEDVAVSTRRVFHTLLDLAGVARDGSLRAVGEEVVLGEAMKPFLSYGWQPQIMAVAGKTEGDLRRNDRGLRSGERIPAEARNLGSGANLPAAARKALDEYPVPSVDAAKHSGEPQRGGATKPRQPRIRERHARLRSSARMRRGRSTW